MEAKKLFFRNLLRRALLLGLICLPAEVFAVVGDIEILGVPRAGEVITLIDESGKRTDATTEVRKDSSGATVAFIPARNLPEGKYTLGYREVTRTVQLGPGLNRIDLLHGGEPAPGWSISGQVGIEGRQTGRGGSGTLIPAGVTAGQEPFLAHLGKWVPGVAPALNATGNVLGQELQAGVRAFFGSASDRGSEPVGGDPVGITFDEQVSGSNGLNLGATGARAKVKVDINSFEVNVALPALFYRKQINGFEFKFGPRAVIGYDETDYKGEFQGETFTGIFSRTRRDVAQTYGGPGVTLQKTMKATEHIELYAGVNLDALYSSASYDGRQRTRCNLCAPALQDTRIKTSDSESGWAFRPAVSLGAEYEWNSSSFGITAAYEYWTSFFVLRDRPNPLKPSPGLKEDSVHRGRLGIFYQYKF